MRLKLEQLATALEKKIAAVYVLSGDEPLQLNEAADKVRSATKKAGYNNRETFAVDTGFAWHDLATATDSVSIFADKKLIDLRIASTKLGVEGSKALIRYCQRLSENTVLLITMPKLSKANLATKCLQALDKAGVIVQVWAIDGADLLRWLTQRAKKRGLQIETEGIKTLASCVEGNLLAAAQEIEKLYVLHGQAKLSENDIAQSVASNARFDVFKLTDCVLADNMPRATTILHSLQAEGVVAPIVLWALTRDTRLLLNIKTAINSGQNKEQVLHQYRLWDKRKQLVSTAVSRIKLKKLSEMLLLGAMADRQIKGQEKGDCWETLLAYCLLYHA